MNDERLVEPTRDDEKEVSAFDEPHLLGDAPRPRTADPAAQGAGIYTLHRDLLSVTSDAFSELAEWHDEDCALMRGLGNAKCYCHVGEGELWDRWNRLRPLLCPTSYVIPAEHLDALAAERARQEAKFPKQHLPNYAMVIDIIDPYIAKEYTDSRAEQGTLSWSDVLLEEVAEAIDEAERADRANLRTELIQVAAVALRWIEDIDRQAALDG